jgi:hypothetical protein
MNVMNMIRISEEDHRDGACRGMADTLQHREIEPAGQHRQHDGAEGADGARLARRRPAE